MSLFDIDSAEDNTIHLTISGPAAKRIRIYSDIYNIELRYFILVAIVYSMNSDEFQEIMKSKNYHIDMS